MIDIVETIEKYWAQEISAGISGIPAWLGRRVHHWKQEQNLVKRSVLITLHDRLYQACQYYLYKGCCSIDDHDNLEHVFQLYRTLGGSGTGEKSYNRYLALPYESGGEGDNEED